jgi:hypothetical protein
MAIVILSEPFFKDCGTRRRKFIKCRCDCGKEFETRVDKECESCGCGRGFPKTHRKSKTTEYRIWLGMKTRCNNPSNKDWENYGERGIKVCQRWNHSFENFLSDMGERPQGTSIDRIDNNGDYSPENCRWATSSEQRSNRRQTISMTIYGKTMPLTEWLKVNPYVKRSVVIKRLSLRWGHKEAIYGKPR